MFAYAPRDDWLLRKRGIELLTLLLETFPTHASLVQNHVSAVRRIALYLYKS